jgi:iron complex transport system substrate-binding protein
MDETYQKMGELLGVQEKAAELAAYYKDTLNDIQAKAAGIAEDKKVRVYYAEGPDGLTTEPKGSTHIQTLELVGGLNVAAEVESAGRSGQTPVSMEQVLKWDPDVILCWNESSGGAYKIITTDPTWAKLKAVQNNQVYEIPSTPYNWFDRPPSVNRIIGFKWLGNLLYPDIYQYDIAEEVKNFYKSFYHYELTDEELNNELLVHSRRK